MKHLLAMLSLLMIVALLSPAPACAVAVPPGGTLVAADPADPYRALAVLGTTFPAWASAGFGAAVSALLNLLFAQRGLGPALYNYALGLSALPALVVEVMASVAVFAVIGKAAGWRRAAYPR
jgi:hypothetical protein